MILCERLVIHLDVILTIDFFCHEPQLKTHQDDRCNLDGDGMVLRAVEPAH